MAQRNDSTVWFRKAAIIQDSTRVDVSFMMRVDPGKVTQRAIIPLDVDLIAHVNSAILGTIPAMVQA